MPEDSLYKSSTPRGYRPSAEVIQAMRPLAKTNLLVSAGWALTSIALIVMTAVGIGYFSELGEWAHGLAFVFGFLLIGRQLRGLELLIHDAVHFSWDRNNRRRNDFLAKLLIAYPFLLDLRLYREEHVLHHRRFGEQSDICFQRVIRSGVHEANTFTGWKRVRLLAAAFPRFLIDHYQWIMTALLTPKKLCSLGQLGIWCLSSPP